MHGSNVWLVAVFALMCFGANTVQAQARSNSTNAVSKLDCPSCRATFERYLHWCAENQRYRVRESADSLPWLRANEQRQRAQEALSSRAAKRWLQQHWRAESETRAVGAESSFTSCERELAAALRLKIGKSQAAN
jgi:hypothetical protein